VSIAGGQYKGYVGIVKELNDATARVELHTNSKLITVDRERLVIAGASGDSSRSLMTPAVAVGKTPAWGAAASGKTPAWSSATGKTPAWSAGTEKTPAWSSTPAWNAKAATGKTPSWAPPKTPSWQQPEQARSSKDYIQASSWALPGAEVTFGNDRFKIASVEGTNVVMSNPSATKTVRASELAPVVPSKKDRVAIHNQTPILYGSVIGLDGPDAVVKIDGTGEFKIVNVNSLVKIL
jgi:transcription elongation factor